MKVDGQEVDDQIEFRNHKAKHKNLPFIFSKVLWLGCVNKIEIKPNINCPEGNDNYPGRNTEE